MDPDSQPFFFSSARVAAFPLIAATDPVGGLDHSLPIRPEQGSTQPLEYWEDQLHKRRPRKGPPQPPSEKPLEDDHQIDDYA